MPIGDWLPNKVLYGQAWPLGPTPFPFIQLWQKRYHFCIPSIDIEYPFHIPSLELRIPFNCCKCNDFKFHKTSKFSQHFYSHKILLIAVLGAFTDLNDRFPNPFYTLQLVKPLPFHIPETWKRTPFRRSLWPRINQSLPRSLCTNAPSPQIKSRRD